VVSGHVVNLISGLLSTRVDALIEIEQAHAEVGGSKRGRWYGTQQINQTYAVILASQFQGFAVDFSRNASITW
jgi:hypothetical protein